PSWTREAAERFGQLAQQAARAQASVSCSAQSCRKLPHRLRSKRRICAASRHLLIRIHNPHAAQGRDIVEGGAPFNVGTMASTISLRALGTGVAFATAFPGPTEEPGRPGRKRRRDAEHQSEVQET